MNFIPFVVSLDFNSNDQLSGLTEAQWGSRSSTGTSKQSPWGPHITIGLNKVSPEQNII